MCNLVAVKVHTRPGDALIADGMAHVIRAESGGAALASGVLVEPIRTARGVFTPAELAAAMDRVTAVPVPYGQPVGVVCVEQTHNFGGGAVWPLDALQAVSACARERGVPVHLDGARLLNACARVRASPAADFAAAVDSLWIDFTKGARRADRRRPRGNARVHRGGPPLQAALRRRHAPGGDRGGGVPVRSRPPRRAAGRGPRARPPAGRRSGRDGRHSRPHAGARDEHGLLRRPGGLGIGNAEFLSRLAARGVRMGAAGGVIRAVTHLDVSRADIGTAVAAVRSAGAELVPA